MKTRLRSAYLGAAASALIVVNSWAADAPARGPASAPGGCQQMQGMMGEMGGTMGRMSRQRMTPGTQGAMSGHMDHMGGMMVEMSKMMHHCGNLSDAEKARMTEMHKEMRELRSKITPPPERKAP
jgi:hypothetical protein